MAELTVKYTAPLPSGFTSGTLEIKRPTVYIDSAGRKAQAYYRATIGADRTLTDVQTGGPLKIVAAAQGDPDGGYLDWVETLNVDGLPTPLRQAHRIPAVYTGAGELDLHRPDRTAKLVDAPVGAGGSGGIQAVLSDGLTVTGDGVSVPLSTPGYDAWIGRFWRRAAGQEGVLDAAQRPARFVKLAALDLANYTVGGAGDGFNAVFEGLITPKYSEPYTLHYQADDGIRVWLDDVLVVDNWPVPGQPSAGVGSVSLGLLTIDRPYRMRVEWFQTAGVIGANPNRLYVGWSSATQVEQAIPTIGSGNLIGALPAGGVAGQVLTKQSDIDGDASWTTTANGSAVVFCHIYAASRQDYGSNTWTRVQLTGILEDASTLSKDSQVVIKEAGLYMLSAAAVFINTGNGTYLNAVVRVNNAGRLQLGEDYANGPSKTLTSGGATRLSTGDVVDLWVYTSGATTWGDASNPDAPRATHLTVAKIG